MRRRRALSRRRVLALGIAVLTASACGEIRDPALEPSDEAAYDQPAPALRSEPRDRDRHVFWGDLHIHTAFSYDAFTLGVRALPDDAYVFAKGGTIQHAVGYPIRLSRPLDFAAVTDHAEYLGIARERSLASPETGPSLREVLETGSRWRITLNFLKVTLLQMRSSATREETFGGDTSGAASRAWQEIVSAARRHDQPGRFSAFIGYEWSSMPDEQNLHRNVIYRSDRVPEIPYSAVDSDDPRDLWKALEEQRRRGMEAIAIPHNANLSNGLMYDRVQFDGSPMTADYASTRMRNEPVSEILQVKGASETHPALSREDEFADFEIYDQMLDASGAPSEPGGSYARDAFKTGLELQVEAGLNPYRFGVIGSSDGHNASAPVEEDRYHGKLPLIDGTPGVRLGVTLVLPDSVNRGLQWSAMGLAAVWAEENTRASLFDAMRRKETYATSGPRITVRFFGGWDLEPDLVERPGWVARAYDAGVPMGGTLAGSGSTAPPRFALVALKDPAGANLDRIQIVKGWVDSSGRAREKVFDVAASDERVPDPQSHRVGPVGNTVDVASASYTNTIGAAQLRAVWADPEHGPEDEAFYYARVIEIPTPRWSTYDARALGVEAPEPAWIQERAVTSPIWVTPRARRSEPAR